jgi:hypothetical protein
MTTDHVALSIMHRTTPEIEAGTEKAPATTGKKTRKFVDVQTKEERRAETIEIVKSKLPKTLGEFKVTGITKIDNFKSSTWIYVGLTDKDGAEPIGKWNMKEATAFEKPLADVEKLPEIAKLSPKVVLTIDHRYIANKRKTASKAGTPTKPDAVPALSTAALKPDRKATDSKKKQTAPRIGTPPKANGLSLVPAPAAA